MAILDSPNGLLTDFCCTHTDAEWLRLEISTDSVVVMLCSEWVTPLTRANAPQSEIAIPHSVCKSKPKLKCSDVTIHDTCFTRFPSAATLSVFYRLRPCCRSSRNDPSIQDHFRLDHDLHPSRISTSDTSDQRSQAAPDASFRRFIIHHIYCLHRLRVIDLAM